MTNVCGMTDTGKNVCPGIVFGATIPAPIWKEFMDLALAGQPAEDFPAPNPTDQGNLYSVPEPKGSYTGCGPASTPLTCYGAGGAPTTTTIPSAPSATSTTALSPPTTAPTSTVGPTTTAPAGTTRGTSVVPGH